MTHLAHVNPTMTSLELVDFINADRKQRAEAAGAAFPSKGFAELRHDDFLRKVPEVLGEEHARNFSAMFPVAVGNGATRKSKGYRLPKREACLMAMSYSYDLQAKVFDRMTALEAAQPVKPAVQLPDFTDPAEAAIAWAAEYRGKREAEGALAIAAPKAAALDLISAGHDTVTITEAAKVLGIKRAALVARMHADGWIYRQNQSWVAYDQHIKNGRLQYKEARYTDEKTGMECVKPYCHITQKGLAKLAMSTSLVEVAA